MHKSDSHDWQERTRFIVETMREMSRQTDPQQMVSAYAARMENVIQVDGHVSLSRRGLTRPQVRITRSSTWEEDINPWKQKDRLPVLSGGILSDLIWEEEPRIIDDLSVSPDDPAYKYLQGYRSLMALPHFHEGAALNMVIFTRHAPAAFDRESFPEMVLTSNLFGRATNNLVLSAELKAAYESLDRELTAVAEIQRALLPPKLPDIPTLELASHYQTSRRAGGDYYDFFPLPAGKWGIFIGDVSGHGTPSAVLMAITHTIAHSYPGDPMPPGDVLTFLNRILTRRYTQLTSNFVTALYAVYDPATRTLTYARAGHNPPRLCRKRQTSSLEEAAALPLGILEDERYHEATVQLQRGDQLVLYTDGITESFNASRDMFDVPRLDQIIAANDGSAHDLVAEILSKLDAFTNGAAAADDRTLVVAKVL